MLPLCSQLHLAAAATTRLLKRQLALRIAQLALRTVLTRRNVLIALTALVAKDATAQL